MKVTAVAVLSILCVSQIIEPSQAETVDPEWKKLVENYLGYAFSGKTELRKIDSSKIIPISIDCQFIENDRCAALKWIFLKSFTPNPNVGFKGSTSPVIKYVFTDNPHIDLFSSQTEKEFERGFEDKTFPQCQLFYTIANSRIESAKVLISANLTDDIVRTCIIYHTSQAIGVVLFNLGDFFRARVINKEKGINSLALPEIDDIQHTSTIIEYIHMCDGLSAGMHIDQVRDILLTNLNCKSKIRGLV